ncbi:probable serine/threonine-protein kinase ifkA [Rhopilema esculentum]|uniref:probable serine/threonine-protein kinase ifkA n=1 Tax=Rhopilema esculentum TaxID=499914 RepID=UPI0031D50E22|eukprot:gene2445-18099_t
MPSLGDYGPQPTNVTRVGEDNRKENRDDDVRLYILIVVGASVFLLLIPLFSYMVRWSKRKLRRRKRRKQAEKAHARVMAEKEIIQQRMYESQLAKRQTTKPAPLQLDATTADLEVPPRSPIPQDENVKVQVTPTVVSAPVPLAQENGTVEVQKAACETSSNGTKMVNGLTNKGYQGSNSILSIPMRKSTSDLYLPQTSIKEHNAKRRFSEDWIGNRDNALRKEKAVKEMLQQDVDSKEKESTDQEIPENDTSSTPTLAETKCNGLLDSSSPDQVKSLNGIKEKGNDSDSDDYDDICDDIYENVKGNETDDDGPIYDNVKGIDESDSDHIYSNVDELSDNGSHIYTNVDESMLEGDAKESGENDSGDDDYENINFAYRNNRRVINGSEEDESDTSSVSYENVWDSDDSDIEQSKVEEKSQSPSKVLPPLVPRRIPLGS